MDSDGWRDVDLKAMDGVTAMDGSLTVMDGAAASQWRWMAQRLLNGDGR